MKTRSVRSSREYSLSTGRCGGGGGVAVSSLSKPAGAGTPHPPPRLLAFLPPSLLPHGGPRGDVIQNRLPADGQSVFGLCDLVIGCGFAFALAVRFGFGRVGHRKLLREGRGGA